MLSIEAEKRICCLTLEIDEQRVSLQVVLNDMPEFNFCQMEEILNLSS